MCVYSAEHPAVCAPLISLWRRRGSCFKLDAQTQKQGSTHASSSEHGAPGAREAGGSRAASSSPGMEKGTGVGHGSTRGIQATAALVSAKDQLLTMVNRTTSRSQLQSSFVGPAAESLNAPCPPRQDPLGSLPLSGDRVRSASLAWDSVGRQGPSTLPPLPKTLQSPAVANTGTLPPMLRTLQGPMQLSSSSSNSSASPPLPSSAHEPAAGYSSALLPHPGGGGGGGGGSTAAAPSLCVLHYFSSGAQPGSESVPYGEQSAVQDVVDAMLQARPHARAIVGLFALRETHVPTRAARWLPRTWRVTEVRTKHVAPLLCRYDLRIRYLPKGFWDELAKNPVLLTYLYQQEWHSFHEESADTESDGMALQLGCLHIQRSCNSGPYSVEEKKFLEHLERSRRGLRVFFPESLLSTMKGKTLRRQVQEVLRLYAGLTQEQCMERSLRLMAAVRPFYEERVPCELGNEWPVQVQLVIGPESDISYSTDTAAEPLLLARLDSVCSVEVAQRAERGCVLLRVRDSGTPLALLLRGLPEAESLSSLLDGHCRVAQGGVDGGVPSLLAVEVPGGGAFDVDDYAEISDNDSTYCCLPARRGEVPRASVRVFECLGKGHFGDVHRGLHTDEDGVEVPVAVKTCKDPTLSKVFLQEAYTMQLFDHPHIVRFAGVIAEGEPQSLLMELCQFGELRAYLLANYVELSQDLLLSFICQISMALSYLEGRKVVHRDVAARNVLVAARDCVKLGDFGLSRSMGDSEYYRAATKSKLPIKWMAPETISFSKYTSASDVWMFGVCTWEILCRGEKPFPAVRNEDVLGRVEKGERLAMPAGCPPKLYHLMGQCWAREPLARPTFYEIKRRLQEIRQEEGAQVEPRVKVPWRMTWGVDSSPSKPALLPSSLSLDMNYAVPQRSQAEEPNELASAVPSASDALWPQDELQQLQQLQQQQLQQQQQSEAMARDGLWLHGGAESGAARAFEGQQPSGTQKETSHLEWTIRVGPERQDAPSCPDGEAFVPRKPPRPGAPAGAERDVRGETEHTGVKAGEPVLPGRTAERERAGDAVFSCVTQVVQAVLHLNSESADATADQLVALVKTVGVSLRALLSAVEDELLSLPPETHHQVQMGERLLNADLSRLIGSLRTAQQYADTTVAQEIRKPLLNHAHILALDTKALLDTVDQARESQAPP